MKLIYRTYLKIMLAEKKEDQQVACFSRGSKRYYGQQVVYKLFSTFT